MFVCLKGFVYVVFGLWVREKKNFETWSGAGSGREISLLLGFVKWFCGVHRRKSYFLLGFVMVKAEQ